MKKVLFVLMALLVASPAMAAVGTFTFGTPVTSVPNQVTIPWTATAGVVGISVKVDVTAGTASGVVLPAFFDVFLDSAYSIGSTYTIGQGVATAMQAQAGQLLTPGASFSICAGGLDDDGIGTGTEEAPTSGSIVINGTAGKTVVLSADTLRGGIVGYDGAMTVVGLPLTTAFGADSLAAPTNVAATDGTAATTITVTWTASAGATSYDVYKSLKNDSATATLAGNVAASPYVYSAGTTQTNAQGATTYFWVKAKNSSVSPFSAGDSGYVTEFMAHPSTPVTEYTDWVAWGRPNCWGFKKQCKGDTNGAGLGGKPVTSVDVTLLATAFGKTDAELALVTNGICADLNHTALGGKRVTSADVTAEATNFGLLDASVAQCVNPDITFWKN